MSPFKPFQPYIGTSDVSSSCSGILLKTRADAVKTESFDSDNTCQKHQEDWCRARSEDVSSRASPEVLGAVDLLSLKRATWSTATAHDAQHNFPWYPDGRPATNSDASAAWHSAGYLCASSGFSMTTPSPSRNNASSSTCSRHCRNHRAQMPCKSRHRSVAPSWDAPNLSCRSRAGCTLNSNRSHNKSKSRGREPACIKEWAALTTWLRMNLHQARTAKRQVCFVGQRSHELGRWVFDLNPDLPWTEVSRETKLRLRSLPKEAEQAFVHKYPTRDPSGWQDKALKYKPGCSSAAYDIAMGPLVSDLHSLYLKHEVHSRRSMHM